METARAHLPADPRLRDSARDETVSLPGLTWDGRDCEKDEFCFCGFNDGDCETPRRLKPWTRLRAKTEPSRGGDRRETARKGVRMRRDCERYRLLGDCEGTKVCRDWRAARPGMLRLRDWIMVETASLGCSVRDCEYAKVGDCE